MKRREVLAIGAGAMLAPSILSAAPLAYEPGLVTKELDAGNTVFLDFKASWCGTCAAQGRVINALKDENPAYEQEITFINVDWDTFKNADLTKNLKIPRRSTLVVLKGDQELGRIVAGTSKKDIKGLMDVALNAAMA